MSYVFQTAIGEVTIPATRGEEPRAPDTFRRAESARRFPEDDDGNRQDS